MAASDSPALPYRRAFPARADAVRQIRHELGEIARECGLTDRGIDDVRLAVSEVVTNAIVHGYGQSGAEGEIRVQVFLSGEEMLIVVADDGAGVAPRVGSPGMGLGLPVVAALAMRFEVRSQEGEGAEVHMVFPCPGRAPCS